MATWREALTLAETRRDEPSARKREEEQRTRRRRGMKGRSGELVRVEIEILSVRGDFTWAVGRAVVLVQFCDVQLECWIEPARWWGHYYIIGLLF